MLDICLIGTGGMMPLPNRWLASMMVRYNGKIILFDCGEGTQIPMKTVEWGFKAIDAICFTHYHGDHVAGLPGLLLTIGNSGRQEPLLIMGPPGLTDVVKGMRVIAPELPYELILEELPYKERVTRKIGDVFVSSTPADHTIPCLAYGIEIKRAAKFDPVKAKQLDIPVQFWGKLQKGEDITYQDKLFKPEMVLGEARKGLKACYYTDSRPLDAMADFIKGSDLFICEGMYGDDENYPKAVEKKHMLFSEAAGLAKEGNVKEMWLTHYSPALNNPEDYLDVARNIFPATELGKDCMCKTLRFEE